MQFEVIVLNKENFIQIPSIIFSISLTMCITLFILSFILNNRFFINILDYIYYIPFFISIVGIILAVILLFDIDIYDKTKIKKGLIGNLIVVLLYILVYGLISLYFVPR